MAVIRDDVIVAPGVDILTDAQLTTTTLEPGIYTLNASKTIEGQTSSRWTVICIGNNVGSAPVCYSQIWLPAQSNISGSDQNIYMRTINSAGTGFGNFTKFVSANTGVVNQTSYPLEIYAQTSAPTTSSGKNIIWIDTSV